MIEMCPVVAPASAQVQRAWRVLHTVLDPEVPVLSVCDLGIVRDVIAHGDGIEVVLTPTYSGCPATEVIEQAVVDAIDAAGLGPTRITVQRAPAWTTDWISDEGREKLRAYGIAPPPKGAGAAALKNEASAQCPRCGSSNTEEISRFGATPCKALWRCLACAEPFDRFKCH